MWTLYYAVILLKMFSKNWKNILNILFVIFKISGKPFIFDKSFRKKNNIKKESRYVDELIADTIKKMTIEKRKEKKNCA